MCCRFTCQTAVLTERQFSAKLSFVCYPCTIIVAFEWPTVLFSAGGQWLYSGACPVACALTTYQGQPEAGDMADWQLHAAAAGDGGSFHRTFCIIKPNINTELIFAMCLHLVCVLPAQLK
jgi:hypothetical protein